MSWASVRLFVIAYVLSRACLCVSFSCPTVLSYVIVTMCGLVFAFGVCVPEFPLQFVVSGTFALHRFPWALGPWSFQRHPRPQALGTWPFVRGTL